MFTRTLEVRGLKHTHPVGFITPRLLHLRRVTTAIRAALRAREASPQLEDAIRAERPDAWIEIPDEPAKPGQLQIRNRRIYVGPTTADLKRFTEQ